LDNGISLIMTLDNHSDAISSYKNIDLSEGSDTGFQGKRCRASVEAVQRFTCKSKVS
jgi:hypothetical protein